MAFADLKNELNEVPADLPPGPYREALALANEASFTALELEAYRRVMDEIQQARAYGDAREAQGEARGLREGEAKGLRAAVVDLCELLDLALSEGQRSRLAAMRVDELEALRQHLKRERRCPD